MSLSFFQQIQADDLPGNFFILNFILFFDLVSRLKFETIPFFLETSAPKTGISDFSAGLSLFTFHWSLQFHSNSSWGSICFELVNISKPFEISQQKFLATVKQDDTWGGILRFSSIFSHSWGCTLYLWAITIHLQWGPRPCHQFFSPCRHHPVILLDLSSSMTLLS